MKWTPEAIKLLGQSLGCSQHAGLKFFGYFDRLDRKLTICDEPVFIGVSADGSECDADIVLQFQEAQLTDLIAAMLRREMGYWQNSASGNIPDEIWELSNPRTCHCETCTKSAKNLRVYLQDITELIANK